MSQPPVNSLSSTKHIGRFEAGVISVLLSFLSVRLQMFDHRQVSQEIHKLTQTFLVILLLKQIASMLTPCIDDSTCRSSFWCPDFAGRSAATIPSLTIDIIFVYIIVVMC